MANKASVEEETASKEKKSNNMLVIIIIVVLVLIIILGAVGFLLLSGGGDDEAARDKAPQSKEKSTSKPKRVTSSTEIDESRQLNDIGILYPLDTFTVNLKSDAGRRYLKVTMSLELEGENLVLNLMQNRQF